MRSPVTFFRAVLTAVDAALATALTTALDIALAIVTAVARALAIASAGVHGIRSNGGQIRFYRAVKRVPPEH